MKTQSGCERGGSARTRNKASCARIATLRLRLLAPHARTAQADRRAPGPHKRLGCGMLADPCGRFAVCCRTGLGKLPERAQGQAWARKMRPLQQPLQLRAALRTRARHSDETHRRRRRRESRCPLHPVPWSAQRGCRRLLVAQARPAPSAPGPWCCRRGLVCSPGGGLPRSACPSNPEQKVCSD